MADDSLSIRPLQGSWTRRLEGDPGVLMCGGCMQAQPDDILNNDDENDTEDKTSMPPRMLSSPSMPSRQEIQEHNVTHIPFRSWCPFCVAGKSKCAPHKRGIDHSDDAVPLVAFDYCFMGDRAETDADNITILVARDRKSRCYAVIPVPQKELMLPNMM